jgi:protease-4
MSFSDSLTTVARVLIVLVVAAVAAVAGWFLFVDYPQSLTDLVGVLLAIGVVAGGLQLGSRLVGTLMPGYNVAEVPVEGPITRKTGSAGLPSGPTTPGADDVVDRIEAADADRHVEALLVKLNTPGGEVVPSDDIRRAAAEFDGPTIGYTQDMCASGGMWIASGCDELWARDGSIVGSIGVIFAQIRISELMDRVGVDYEGISSGEYKDALSPFKPMKDDEREYVQALSDAWYENFVERVAEGTDMDEAAIRETEARVYLGEEAVELDMVDELGTREDIEDRLEAELGEPVTVEEFRPQHSLAERLRGGAHGVAYAVGAGIAGRFADGEGGLRMR